MDSLERDAIKSLKTKFQNSPLNRKLMAFETQIQLMMRYIYWNFHVAAAGFYVFKDLCFLVFWRFYICEVSCLWGFQFVTIYVCDILRLWGFMSIRFYFCLVLCLWGSVCEVIWSWDFMYVIFYVFGFWGGYFSRG